MRKAFLPYSLLSFMILFISSNSFSQEPVAVSSTYRGDINEDGQVNIFDMLEMLKLLKDPEGKTERTRQIADMDGSGTVNIFDFLGMLRALYRSEKTQQMIWITDTKFITMSPIPSVKFQMGGEFGSERPVHPVTISAFWMSQHEITQAQYMIVMGSNPSLFTGDDRRPVEQVSWYDAVTFCNKLSEIAGFLKCYDLSTWQCDFDKNGFRLPTEAEWEYACRAGTSTGFNTGESESDLALAGWYLGNSSGKTHAIGNKEANSFGLYDMHGNVCEWCNDWYDPEYYSNGPMHNPTGPESGFGRVARGGSFFNIAKRCRSAFRFGANLDPSTECSWLGLRMVRR